MRAIAEAIKPKTFVTDETGIHMTQILYNTAKDIMNVFHSYSEMRDMKYILILPKYFSHCYDISDIKGTGYCAMDRESVLGTIKDYAHRNASGPSIWITQFHIQIETGFSFHRNSS
jgi:hypothetical protein